MMLSMPFAATLILLILPATRFLPMFFDDFFLSLISMPPCHFVFFFFAIAFLITRLFSPYRFVFRHYRRCRFSFR